MMSASLGKHTGYLELQKETHDNWHWLQLVLPLIEKWNFSRLQSKYLSFEYTLDFQYPELPIRTEEKNDSY